MGTELTMNLKAAGEARRPDFRAKGCAWTDVKRRWPCCAPEERDLLRA